MNPLWRRLTQTANDPTLTIARWVLAAIFIGHGTQKTLGWFGGMGFERSLVFFQDTMGVPPALTILLMFTELAAAAGFIAGFLTRIAATGLLIVMVVAPFVNHLYPRFFMNWSGTRGGEGYEYHLLAISLLLVLILRGSGALSLDRLLARGQDSDTKVA
ncbi:MAG: DoxX family protein [Bryobacteraceae bacterium]